MFVLSVLEAPSTKTHYLFVQTHLAIKPFLILTLIPVTEFWFDIQIWNNIFQKVWKKKMHNHPREPQPCEDCQAKSIQEFGTSQGMDWVWGQGIKSHYTQTSQGIWLQLSSEASYLG